jgi:hypothetical protein
MKTLLLSSAAAALVLMPALVEAAEPEKQVSLGVQTLLGGSLYSAPDNPPPNYQGLGFVDSAGGFSWASWPRESSRHPSAEPGSASGRSF